MIDVCGVAWGLARVSLGAYHSTCEIQAELVKTNDKTYLLFSEGRDDSNRTEEALFVFFFFFSCNFAMCHGALTNAQVVLSSDGPSSWTDYSLWSQMIERQSDKFAKESRTYRAGYVTSALATILGGRSFSDVLLQLMNHGK